jgi:uracil phosphoribosyltransferase
MVSRKNALFSSTWFALPLRFWTEVAELVWCQIAAPEGLKAFCSRFPMLKVVTGWIDEGLNDKAYIIPGLGDFGERR